MSDGIAIGLDGRLKCWWCIGDALYEDYHDGEWGRPLHGDDELFEKLCLDGLQAGLSWLVVLRKRASLRAAFHGFDPRAIALFSDSDVERLLSDPGVIRNRAKIRSVIGNARALLDMHAGGEALDGLVWSHTRPAGRRPVVRADVPAASPESEALSRALKARGFSFVGSTIVYAFMQAVGVVDDHVAGCIAAGDSAIAGRVTSRVTGPVID
ncbi:MAG TPA: DNA-3-methyladenine glycosylase I [Egibacteraceae bacterium]|nr:DNA-3-methyladenine glycosylase I [Egibacteraceae bacterium]